MPTLGIANGNDPDVNAERLWPFIKVFTATTLQDGEDYIIEGSDLLPARVYELLPANNITAVFLGYATATTDNKVGRMRSHPTEKEWTATMSGTELHRLVTADINRSRYLQDQCAMHGIQYYDLNVDFQTGIAAIADRLLAIQTAHIHHPGR